jgi:hypothetical protein
MTLDQSEDRSIVRQCDYCGEPIYEGEEFWEIDQELAVHFDCVDSMSIRDMVDFLDLSVSDIVGRFDFVETTASNY